MTLMIIFCVAACMLLPLLDLSAREQILKDASPSKIYRLIYAA